MLVSLARNQSGSAAVEMALVMPILLVLMFGSFELGNYFLDNHLVTKAVRDGARYASRSVPLQDSCEATKEKAEDESDVIENTQRVTLYGKLVVTDDDKPRLPDWVTDDITVQFDCSTTGGPAGIYSGMADSSGTPDGAPLVTVTATVAYRSLFGEMAGVRGFSTSGFNITARSQVPVMGL
jgi:hypothetical protein